MANVIGQYKHSVKTNGYQPQAKRLAKHLEDWSLDQNNLQLFVYH